MQLRNWIKKYNDHEELKASVTGGKPVMTKGRKTTYEERIAIVRYCIENQNNYTETAKKFQVSYQQIYTWMKTYQESGIDELLKKARRNRKEMGLRPLRHAGIYEAILGTHQKYGYPIRSLCQIGQVTRAAYYKWLNRKTPENKVENIINIKSTIKYANKGCTSQAANPQYIADNVLVFETFGRAMLESPNAHPLSHSDRGFQYTSRLFHKKLMDAQMVQNMSRVGKCIDNGPIEGFWESLKESDIMESDLQIKQV